MGAWGFGVFDNDEARDIMADMEYMIGNREPGEAPYTAATAIPPIKYADDVDLVFMMRFYGDFGETGKIREMMGEFEELLEAGALSGWTDPDKRLRVVREVHDRALAVLSGAIPPFDDDEESILEWIREARQEETVR